eukprot:160692-Amphidinium_carterae.2
MPRGCLRLCLWYLLPLELQCAAKDARIGTTLADLCIGFCGRSKCYNVTDSNTFLCNPDHIEERARQTCFCGVTVKQPPSESPHTLPSHLQESASTRAKPQVR